MNILSIDPGIQNFGYSVINIETGKVIACKKLTNPINKFNDKEQLNRFNKEINSIINTYSIKEITAERFLVRSQHLKGISTELVSFMLGILSTKRYIRLVIAAQWKNWINSNDKELLNTLYILYNHLETHQIDAVLIGYYVYSLNIQEALKFFKDSRKCQYVPIMKITNSQNVVTKSVKTGQIKQKQDV